MKLNDISNHLRDDININTNKKKLQNQDLSEINSNYIDCFNLDDDNNTKTKKNINNYDFSNLSNKNLNDINNFRNKKDVNIKKYFTKSILRISKNKKILSKDISKIKSKTIKFESQKNVKILENNNKYSDSVVKDPLLRNINVLKKVIFQRYSIEKRSFS